MDFLKNEHTVCLKLRSKKNSKSNSAEKQSLYPQHLKCLDPGFQFINPHPLKQRCTNKRIPSSVMESKYNLSAFTNFDLWKWAKFSQVKDNTMCFIDRDCDQLLEALNVLFASLKGKKLQICVPKSEFTKLPREKLTKFGFEIKTLDERSNFSRASKVSNEKQKIKKVGAVIQARMGSVRLPNKALLELNKRAIIEHILVKFEKEFGRDHVVLATSLEKQNDALEKLCRQKGYNIFRGEEANVANRFSNCATEFGFRTIIRITGDDLFRDISNIKSLISKVEKNNFDYAVSDHLILGCNSEVFSSETVDFVATFAKKPKNTESLSWFLDQKEIFNVYETKPTKGPTRKPISLMLVEPRDFEAIKKFCQIFPEVLHPDATYNIIRNCSEKAAHLFSFHPEDVGLLERLNLDVSFDFRKYF
jgi:spore coat polysaccharide biosynthesis protein SpsF